MDVFRNMEKFNAVQNPECAVLKRMEKLPAVMDANPHMAKSRVVRITAIIVLSRLAKYVAGEIVDPTSVKLNAIRVVISGRSLQQVAFNLSLH